MNTTVKTPIGAYFVVMLATAVFLTILAIDNFSPGHGGAVHKRPVLVNGQA